MSELRHFKIALLVPDFDVVRVLGIVAGLGLFFSHSSLLHLQLQSLVDGDLLFSEVLQVQNHLNVWIRKKYYLSCKCLRPKPALKTSRPESCPLESRTTFALRQESRPFRSLGTCTFGTVRVAFGWVCEWHWTAPFPWKLQPSCQAGKCSQPWPPWW